MDNVIRAIDETLVVSVRDGLRQFVQQNQRREFSIFSDYCLEDKQKPNKVVAFTIMPHDCHINEYIKFLSKIVPKDLKNSRSVNPDFLHHIAEPRLFHLIFILGSLKGLTQNAALSGRNHTIQALNNTEAMIRGWQRNQLIEIKYFDLIRRKLNQMRKSVDKKSPNLNLFRQVLIVSLLVAFLAYLLTLEAKATIVGWFSDRDKIIQAWDAIALDIFLLNYNALCERNKINGADTKIIVGAVEQESEMPPWFDSINRIPDYLAGTVASWNLEKNTVHLPKHLSVLRGCFVDNSFCSIFKIAVTSTLLQCSRVVVSRAPIYA
ncbi:MAG: hypothetical protein U1F76_13820 [Candidatus Competibacteraceae bacterium]